MVAIVPPIGRYARLRKLRHERTYLSSSKVHSNCLHRCVLHSNNHAQAASAALRLPNDMATRRSCPFELRTSTKTLKLSMPCYLLSLSTPTVTTPPVTAFFFTYQWFNPVCHRVTTRHPPLHTLVFYPHWNPLSLYIYYTIISPIPSPLSLSLLLFK